MLLGTIGGLHGLFLDITLNLHDNVARESLDNLPQIPERKYSCLQAVFQQIKFFMKQDGQVVS
jgi:hypothetical protein